MKEDQPLTHCRKKCGNNFHIKCLRVWIDHKLSSGDKITCPMCRTDMTNGIFDDIRKDEDDFNVRYVTHFGKNCNGCQKKNILGNLYHCLICENIDLCHFCYDSNQHPIHQKFLLKKKKDSEWEIAFQRIKKASILPSSNLKLDPHVLSINHHHHQQQSLQSQYRHNNGIDLKPMHIFNTLADYLVSCFPIFKDINQEQQLTSGLSIIGQEMNKNKTYCALCNQPDAHGLMRKLSCGHGIDSLCLKQLISQQKMLCPTCQSPILKGYITAFNLKPKKAIPTESSNEIIKEIDANQIGNKKTVLQKGVKIMKGSSLKDGSDLSLTGNLLQPFSSQLNIAGATGLEINGERKNLLETDQQTDQGLSLQNTKKSTNFRIKKTKPITNKPPLNKPIKNDINARIREQKENLQSLIQQGEFQLVGREIFIKKDKNEADNTIRGNTNGQQHKRNSIRQNPQFSINSSGQISHQDNKHSNGYEYNEDNYGQLYSQYQNQEQLDCQNQEQMEDQNEELNEQFAYYQASLDSNHNYHLNEQKPKSNQQKNIKQLHLNEVIDSKQDSQQRYEEKEVGQQQEEEEEEEEEEEVKENYYNNKQDAAKEVQVQKCNKSQKSDELDDEDEEFQRQMIEDYERQFGGNVEQSSNYLQVEDSQQQQQQINLLHHKNTYEVEQNKIKQNKIKQNNQNYERSSSQYLINQNTTDFSSTHNIAQSETEFVEDASNNYDDSEHLAMQGNILDRTNSIQARQINYLPINSSKNISQNQQFNHKVRISKSTKISQQRHGQQVRNPTNVLATFEVIGQQQKPQMHQTQQKVAISSKQFQFQ